MRRGVPGAAGEQAEGLPGVPAGGGTAQAEGGESVAVIFPKQEKTVPTGAARADENPFAALKIGRWHRISWAGQNRGGHSEAYPDMGKLEWVHPEGRYAVFRARGGYAFCVGRGHLAAGARVLPALIEGGKAARGAV